MNFAIVKFLEEDNAPGIVSTNWLTKDKDVCFFPNVGHESTKNRLLLARKEPESNWLRCRVTVLKEYSNYQVAKESLTDAEYTSTLESENESKSRKRKKKVICYPGEMSSSDDERPIPSIQQYPVPPKKSSQGHQFESAIQYRGAAESDLEVPGSPQFERVFELAAPLEASNHPVAVELYTQPHQESINNIKNDIQDLKNNVKNLWTFSSELGSILSRIEAKVDIIASRSAGAADTSRSFNDEEFCLLAALPVDTDGLAKLEEQLAGSQSFRQRLRKLLLSTSGKDSKSLVSNILRKVVDEGIADNYSLTGKSSSGFKLPFEKTTVYKVILDVCFRNFGNSQEAIIRETISDWLMQAKYRRSKREDFASIRLSNSQRKGKVPASKKIKIFPPPEISKFNKITL